MDGRIFDPESPQIKPPMPNLNSLASSGAVFTRAYNQAPQCVPSRSAMMVGSPLCALYTPRAYLQPGHNTAQSTCTIRTQVGLRTDQIGVFDNFVGGIAIDGNSSNPDSYCVKAFNRSMCIALSKQRGENSSTFIDRLSHAGYGIHLYGKMHAGWGLDRYPGSINAFPFTNGATGSPKVHFLQVAGLVVQTDRRYVFPPPHENIVCICIYSSKYTRTYPNASWPNRNSENGRVASVPSPTSKALSRGWPANGQATRSQSPRARWIMSAWIRKWRS